MNVLFLTVTDENFFPGTIATINSILDYHPQAMIAVVDYDSESENGLNENQKNFLMYKNIFLYKKEDFIFGDRVNGAWQAKTYAMTDILKKNDYDIIIGIDSDSCILSNLDDIINKSVIDGKIRGGHDSGGEYYSADYKVYGITDELHYKKYMSTSLYFVPNNDLNKKIFREASECTNKAIYGSQEEKIYPGHGDQGVLNAIIYKNTQGDNVDLLENEIWSMHWSYSESIVKFDGDKLINLSFDGKPFRSFHSPSMEKIWSTDYFYSQKYQNQKWIYIFFLRYLFAGQISLLNYSEPYKILDETYGHLYKSFFSFKEEIEKIKKCKLRPPDNFPY